MILSDGAILKLAQAGELEIIPPIEEIDVRPAGIRIHLADRIMIPEPGQIVDPTVPATPRYNEMQIGEEGFLMKPGDFVLGCTYEKIRMPKDLVGFLEGRSTIARLGLAIHCTSGIIDNMHDEPRVIVLEIINHGVFTIKLRAGMPIGMLVLAQMTCAVQQASHDQYRHQDSPVIPNLHFQTRKRF